MMLHARSLTIPARSSSSKARILLAVAVGFVVEVAVVFGDAAVLGLWPAVVVEPLPDRGGVSHRRSPLLRW